MASISNRPNGQRRLLFVDPAGKRKTIYLGKMPKRHADAIKIKVEQLVAAVVSGCPWDNDTSRWVAELPDTLASKLANVGLIGQRENALALTLGEHLHNYMAKRTDVKAATAVNWGHTQRNLLKFFGPDRRLSSVTAGDARDFERWLRTIAARENRYANTDADQGLSANTARKRISNAKQFFEDAVQREFLRRNPFAGLKGSVGSNRERDHFITREDAQRILDACPNAQWRLIFALCRFGGLRCPTEVLALRWNDVDRSRGRIRVTSTKTEGHEGKGIREIPLFPELSQVLDEAWDQAECHEEYVITLYRAPNTNLRTQFTRILKRAGLTPWPKLFQNLRASRATELASEHPGYVAAAFLGHSTAVANKHYWQVTDEDFDRAIQGSSKAVQNPAQHLHVSARTDSQGTSTADEKTLVLPVHAPQCESLQGRGVGDTGFEPVTSAV